MSIRHMPRWLLGTALLWVALGQAGCYSTQYSLGSPATASVDPALIGDYQTIADDAASATQPAGMMAIRNIDGKQYYVEYSHAGDDHITRMVGFTVKIKDALFAQLQDMPEDGSIPQDHLLMRIRVSDKKLSIQNLNDAFFKDKPIDSDAALRAQIESNVNNPAMYEDEILTATRIPSK